MENNNSGQPEGSPDVSVTPAASPITNPQQPQLVRSQWSAVQPKRPDVVTPAEPQPLESVSEQPQANKPAKQLRKRKWVLPALILLLLLALAGDYVFAVYLPSRPGNLYNASLKNSGLAVDKLVDYANTQTTAHYKSYALDSTVQYTSATGSLDAKSKGSIDNDGNGNLSIDANVLGNHFNAKLLSTKAKANKSPDLYVQLNGVKPLLEQAGLTALEQFDGTWIAVDHTLLDTYASNATSSASGTNGASLYASPSPEQIRDVTGRIQAVNKQYLFTTDTNKAVLVNQKFLGAETLDGRPVNHYKTGYNKAHLQAYVSALGATLDASKLNDVSKQVAKKNLSEMLQFADLKKSIASANANYTFDLWADTKLRVVHAVRFTDANNKNSAFTLSQNYNGGDSYPFKLVVAGSDASTSYTANLGLTLNTKSNNVNVAIGYDTKGAATTSLKASASLTPSSTTVDTKAPATSTPVMQVLNKLGLRADNSSNLGQGTVNQGSNRFTISQ